MPTYWVKVAIPTYYHIVAETKQDAADAATTQYKQEHNTAEAKDSQVLAVEALDEVAELAEIADRGLSSRDEARYLLKRW
jgi:hypothetical protein